MQPDVHGSHFVERSSAAHWLRAYSPVSEHDVQSGCRFKYTRAGTELLVSIKDPSCDSNKLASSHKYFDENFKRKEWGGIQCATE